MIYIYSVPKTHFFLPSLLPRGVSLLLPLPRCDLLLLHAYGHLSKSELLAKLGLSDGFYMRRRQLIALLPTLSKLYHVRCYAELEEERARERLFYEVAKAVYTQFYHGAAAEVRVDIGKTCPEGGVVVVDNYIDYVRMRSCGDWVYLAEPRPTPVEEYLLSGRLDVDKYLKFLHIVYARGYEEAVSSLY
ncbi:MAG: hypothetical protein ACP5J0_04990 [Pyrobaculum sp.]